MKGRFNMNKMYLQSDNSGYGVLVTDGNKWYYWGENEIPAVLIGETDEENAEIICKAITAGMFDADDFINEHSEEELAEHNIPQYDGMSDISEVDSFENDNRDFDRTIWIEINERQA